MDRLTEAIERGCKAGEVGGAVRLLERAGDELVRTFKGLVLQGLIDTTIRRELGDRRRKGKRRDQETPWACPRCGPTLRSELRRNGHYPRRPLTCEGSITLRVPQLVCSRCTSSVPFSQSLAVLYLEGCSYRASKRLIERGTRSAVGLMTLWRSFLGTAAISSSRSCRRLTPLPPLNFPSMN